MDLKKDYYRILDVPDDASLKQIKAAYRKLALKFHPDRVAKDLKKEAELIFREINEAYEVLSVLDKRSAYDLYYKKPVSVQPYEFTGEKTILKIFMKERMIWRMSLTGVSSGDYLPSAGFLRPFFLFLMGC